MNQVIADKLKLLPDTPGVYKMLDETGTVIYVGKAISLKNRVSQYFQAGKDHTPKVRAMVSHIADFETIGVKRGLLFTDETSGPVGKLWGQIIKAAVQPRPRPKLEDCIGCGECAKVCPAKAIAMVEKKPSIDYKKCIRCFCCQEFCPVGAMKVKRTALSRFLEKIR